MTLSTIEVEYACQATKKAVWIWRLLNQLGFTQNKPTIIHTYIQGNLIVIKNHIHHNRTKHIDIQHHYVRDMVVAKEVKFLCCPHQACGLTF